MLHIGLHPFNDIRTATRTRHYHLAYSQRVKMTQEDNHCVVIILLSACYDHDVVIKLEHHIVDYYHGVMC